VLDLTNLINQTIAVTLLMITAFIIMAFGTYVIIIVSFRLPFLFWLRHEAAGASSPDEALNPAANAVSDRRGMAAGTNVGRQGSVDSDPKGALSSRSGQSQKCIRARSRNHV
jgi:hypothetical protein